MAKATADLSRLTGPIRTLRPQSGHPYGVPWTNVARYATVFQREGTRTQVMPELLAGMAVVESDSSHFRADGSVVVRPNDGHDNKPAIGMMQVKPAYHQWRDPKADVWSVDGNVRLASLIIQDGIKRYGSWEQALVTLYFPGDDVNGTTQGSYIATLNSLMAEMRAQTQSAPTPEPPGPVKPKDPYSIIFGGVPYTVEYGFLDDVGLNYYSYGVGHGTSRSTQHTGDDVLVPDDTRLFTPGPGVVTCVGWRGEPTWGQGCGYFADEEGGVGNISVLLDAGVKLVLGHSSRAVVEPGQRVGTGQHVGFSGGMNGPHTHIEVATERRGSYWLLDPKPALREALGGETPKPPPPRYAERVPIPQPGAFTTSATVVALQPGVPVLQRADMGSPAVRKPLDQGEEFQAVYQVIGDDLAIYWVSSLGSRIPVAGTSSEEWPG